MHEASAADDSHDEEADALLDIHMTADHVLVLFHDPQLGRTTTGSGKIHDQPWNGVLE